jgi:hypothetical protein
VNNSSIDIKVIGEKNTVGTVNNVIHIFNKTLKSKGLENGP